MPLTSTRDLAGVAARIVTAAVGALTGEPTLAVGMVGCIQTHGSLASWNTHIHVIATDGGFRPDGTFVSWPAHDATALRDVFRRAVLRFFVRRGLFEREDAEAVLAWPYAGFHVHDAVRVPDGDVAFARRLARYCARNPVALERLEYDGSARLVHYRSDMADGPTAGTETAGLLEFLARLTAHIPNKHQLLFRYYGYYANRVRGMRERRTDLPAAPANRPAARGPWCGDRRAARSRCPLRARAFVSVLESAHHIPRRRHRRVRRHATPGSRSSAPGTALAGMTVLGQGRWNFLSPDSGRAVPQPDNPGRRACMLLLPNTFSRHVL